MEKSFMLSHGDLRIPCKLTQPDNCAIRRVVLGVHGLAGSSTDDIQSAIAEEMSFFYSATVRFDFPSHGESPMGTEDFSLKNCTASVLAVAGWIKEQFPDVDDLCIFATGFGAYVTLACLEDLLELPGRIRLVVQTPSVRMHESLLAMTRLSKETFRAMDRYTFPLARHITVTYSLYEELVTHNVLTTYPIPMLILHGEEDTYIRMDDIRQFRRINEGSRLVIIPGVGHRFQEDGAWDMVLDLTRDWFEYEQVLLTDYR